MVFTNAIFIGLEVESNMSGQWIPNEVVQTATWSGPYRFGGMTGARVRSHTVPEEVRLEPDRDSADREDSTKSLPNQYV